VNSESGKEKKTNKSKDISDMDKNKLKTPTSTISNDELRKEKKKIISNEQKHIPEDMDTSKLKMEKKSKEKTSTNSKSTISKDVNSESGNNKKKKNLQK